MAILTGQALAELRSGEGGVAGGDHAGVRDRVRLWLVRLVESGRLAARERLEAGDVLGALGDPRPGVGTLTLKDVALPAFDWVKIPAGTSRMGSAEDDAEARDDEKPAHDVTLETFWISRYPVTNAQFRPFVDAGGYGQRSFWSDVGWAWLQGADADLSRFPEDLRQPYAAWLARRPAERRRRPFWWDDPRRRAPSRPVVGVCWHEALAYTRWLARLCDGRPRQGRPLPAALPPSFRPALPSEAQWERAARAPESRRWPFGDEFDAAVCNTEEGGLGETSPVGIFSGGKSGFGVEEMAGNVWEWTLDRWGKSVDAPDYRYPYQAGDGRQRIETKDLRVVRGGSYFNNEKDARCAARSGDDPDLFDDGIGFRCVLSLAGSDS